MNIEHELESLPTKSAKIRFLDQQGWPRQKIADKLGIRYQHVRNVLVSSPPQVRESMSQTAVEYSPLIEKIRKIAEAENTSPQSLIDEALSDFIEKKRHGGPRPQVMAAYEQSLKEFGKLYQKLAK